MVALISLSENRWIRCRCCAGLSRNRGGRPIPPVWGTITVESPEVVCQCLSHRRQVAMNPVADPKPSDLFFPLTPICYMVEETGVGVSGLQPYLSRPLTLVHLDSQVHFSYFILMYFLLLYFSRLKWMDILHSVQFLNAGQHGVPTHGTVATNLASKLEKVMSELEQLFD